MAGKDKLRQLCDALKNLCHDLDMPAPFIAVDQEGGRVSRLTSPDFEPIMANSDVLSINDVEKQAKTAHKILSDIGINVNLAPVLDMNFENKDGALKDRCYGKNANELIDFGTHYIKTLQNLGTMSVAKHFPGIGLAKKDPHDERPVVEDSYDEIKQGIYPFSEAIKAGVFGIMTSHVVFNAIDKEPATFSEKICDRILRRELGFNGILFSDDLEMGGISGYDNIVDAARKAYLAGHDICLICHSLEKVEAACLMLREEQEKNPLFAKCIQKSVKRIISLKNLMTKT